MIGEPIGRRGTTLVRRLVLEPGMATPWHVDPFDRITVVVRGEALAIEYRDGREADRIEVSAGETDWDAPTVRVHRAVNVGRPIYEEVTIFFLDRPDVFTATHRRMKRIAESSYGRIARPIPDTIGGGRP